MENKERRKNTRVPFEASVDLRFKGKTFKDCDIRNLSINGMFVLGGLKRNIGERCDITLHLTGAKTKVSLRMKANIVRLEETGIGLHFYEMDLDSFHHLKNIVYYNSLNPDDMEDEFLDNVILPQ